MTAAFRIYRSLEEIEAGFGPSALTVGVFDGVHCGHQRILRRVVAMAEKNGWMPAAVTFDPHPAAVVAPEHAPRLMSTPAERALLMHAAGMVAVVVLPFTEELSRLGPEEFVRRILKEGLDARAVVVGENFRFGRRQAGDTRLLAELGRQYGFLTEVMPAVRRRGRAVSSSEIRGLIERGEVASAARLLGRPYALEGHVVPGRGIGSKLTVPTLNLAPSEKVLPATGVYITRTSAAGHVAGHGPALLWPSVTNVGYRPSFSGDRLIVETHLLQEPGGAAPRGIRIEFLRRLREERKFPSAEELKAQILRDAARARRHFERLRRQGPGARVILTTKESRGGSRVSY